MKKARGAFTLLEIMAVVLIMALMMTLLIPNLGTTRASRLRNSAKELGSHLEYARNRAIMTGQSHRVLINIDDGYYRIEWLDRSQRDEEGTQVTDFDLASIDREDSTIGEDLSIEGFGSGPSVDLAAPAAALTEFAPIPGRLGEDMWIDDNSWFEGMDTAEGWFDKGEVEIVFDRDGTTEMAELILMNGDEYAVLLEVQPLLDIVRITDDFE